jgi:hypothetical protein
MRVFSAKDVIFQMKEENVNDILIYDESGEEIC